MRDRLIDVLRIILLVALAALNLWLADSVFLPWVTDRGRAQYLLVSASMARLAFWLAVSALVVLALRRFAPDRRVSSFGWLALSLVPLANLAPWAAGRLPAFSYVLYDLRYWWWGAVLLAIVLRLEPAQALRRMVAGCSPPCWRVAILLAVIPVLTAVVSTPHLRFSGVLHGDEPKYLRFCENFYQGQGFDISRKRLLKDLGPGDGSRVSANLVHLAGAVREEAALLVNDLAGLLGSGPSTRLRGGQPSPEMFLAGKHPGSVYQLHNPGLSFLLFPGYYLDRRVTGSGVGYHGEFPASLPSVHATLLLLYAGYGLALYALLRAHTGEATLAGALSLLGMLILPTAAFAFQVYPEIPGGLIVFVLARVMLAGLPVRLGGILACGLLAGFLPWLHVRNLAVTLVATLWVLAARGTSLRRRLAFVLGAGLGVMALSLYTYRLTGSLVPIATYGSDAPLSLGRMLRGLPALAVDGVWGLLPHAPLYLLAIAGSALTFRRTPRAFAAVGLLVLAVAIPAAGHGFWAGGSTPGRYLVAAAPLCLIFVTDAWRAWGLRPLFAGTAALLALVSIETAIRYNLYHRKEVGPLIAPAFAGWRPNLLFPSLGTDTWTATRLDVALLVGWAFFAALLLLALLGTAVGGLTGRITAPEYTVPPGEARERALRAFAASPGCAVCWFSSLGAADPADALGNTIDGVFFRTRPAAPRAGERFTVLVRPRSPAGEYVIGDFIVDLGDGTRSVHQRVFGDVRLDHVYARPGDYHVYAWVRWRTGRPVESRLDVTVLP